MLSGCSARKVTTLTCFRFSLLYYLGTECIFSISAKLLSFTRFLMLYAKSRIGLRILCAELLKDRCLSFYRSYQYLLYTFDRQTKSSFISREEDHRQHSEVLRLSHKVKKYFQITFCCCHLFLTCRLENYLVQYLLYFTTLNRH